MVDAARCIVGGDEDILVDTEKYFYTFDKKVRTKTIFIKQFLKRLKNIKCGQVPSQNMVKRGNVSMLIISIYVYNSYDR